MTRASRKAPQCLLLPHKADFVEKTDFLLFHSLSHLCFCPYFACLRLFKITPKVMTEKTAQQVSKIFHCHFVASNTQRKK